MKEPKIGVGDLVYHLIYGKEWLAIVLDMKEVEEKCVKKRNQLCREYVLVHMQSGSKYEDFFQSSLDSTRLTQFSGLISYHWLRRVSW